MANKLDSTTTLQRAVPQRGELEECVALARRKGVPLTDLLLKEKQYSEEALAEAFVKWLKLPRVKIASLTLDPEAAKTISEKIALKHECLPLKIEGEKLVVAMANPADYDAIQDVQFVSGCTVQPVIATRTEILDGIQEIYGTEDRMQDFLSKVADTEDFTIVQETEKLDLDASDRTAAELAPVVKMCNLILQEALHSGASDVHLEPTLNCLQVRMRIDGVLREFTEVPKWLHHPLISRLKILAHLDIAERRLPQDGRIQVKFQKQPVDLRVSTLPTHFGEKMVMRVLGTTSIPALESLGFTDWQYATITEALNQPQGMILLTGPTGSGKTTTLYSMIAKRRSPEVNIVTVEDPIEYQIPGINQVQVNVKAGLTFAGCLRSILRQDPDVILVGEIRDLETAEIAFQAAVTGHLVLSTLHTNSSFAAITRLKDLGLDPFVITSSLNLVVAQRLARRICPQCKKAYMPPADLVQRFRLEKSGAEMFQGEGCPDCGKSGYAGRMGIYEMFRITSPIKELIRQNATEGALRRAAAAGGTRTLMEDGLAKVHGGVTTAEELVRVLEVETEESFPCPKCSGIVHNDFRNCPYCMHTLRNICGACGQELKLDWQMCPYCSSPVRIQNQSGDASGQSAKFLSEANSGLLTEASSSAQSGTLTLAPVATLPPLKRPKILVVDDDEGITRIIQAALKQLPMEAEVFTASDGVAALASIKENAPDMLVLDVMMPRMDGFDVCDTLRKNIKTAFLPIMMLTANTDQNNRTKGYLVGTDDYMNKPFDVPDFIARVARLLRRTYGL